ncbi:MAG: hypothetical protein AAGF47_12985 [Planctomycetota bacterium]
MKTRTIAAATLFLTAFAAPAASQQVEYVTRDVKPTHVVRFEAKPISFNRGHRGFKKPGVQAWL